MQLLPKSIGILGGMGPLSSAQFHLRLIRHLHDHYHAVQDTDYPPIWHYSMPMEGFDETGVADGDKVQEQLTAGVRTLAAQGVAVIAIPCNSVHQFYAAMQNTVKVPILNIIEESVKRVEQAGYKRVGLLTSHSTRALGLYETALKKHGLQALGVTEDEQQQLDTVIKAVMSGKHGKADAAIVHSIATHLVEQGAECVLLGCTELPLAVANIQFSFPMFDSLQILAETTADFVMREK